MRLFCDTNIFVHAFSPESANQIDYSHILSSYEIFLSSQILLESVKVIPSLKHKKFSVKEAVGFMSNLIKKSNISFLSPKQQTFDIWLDLQNRYPLQPRHVFDTYIVATMLTHNITKLLTFNLKDFSFFKEIEVFSPESIIR